jgi:PAS domain S-box-containing protein
MSGGSWSGEVEMVSKSGRKFIALERADAIKDEFGKVIGLVGVHTDITERKSAEDKLRETRDYMENLIEHANVPMVVWTPDFRITRFNRAFERLTGLKAKAVIGKDLEILFPKETREKSMSYMRTALRGARWEVVEMPVLNVQENVKTVLWNISTIYAEDRKTPTAIIAQGQDITERKQAEEALRESEEMARSMLDNAAMGIYLLQNKKFLYVNPTFEKIMGYTSAEIVGQEAINYVHPSDRGIVRIKAMENLKGMSALPYEFRALRKDGKQIWIMERVTSIRYKGRRAVIASFMETTEHRKAEVDLEQAYEELKTAHERMVQSEKLRAMGEMASGIAHDFNNMLAVILGRTQLVIDDVKDDKVKKGIQIIEQAALDAAKTVKRLQDFARIRVEHPFESLDVNQVVEGVLNMVEPRVIELEQTKGIAIKVEQELGKVGQVSGDAAELREALLNILFNAMDAMPTGGKLTVKSWQEEDWVQISIKDTGVGIPDKVKSRVFEPFFSTKASKGSGLGLSVTYGIIARHGGMLKFDSEVGKGTTFYIRLPLAVEAVKKGAKKGKAVAAKPANILTVDDEPEVLKALDLTLEYLGHWVKGVNSGAEAIKAFKDGNYDLVITDLGMPEVSGWDVARAIKKIKPDMPVLLITGWVIDMDEEQKKIVDGVISKPFSRDSISSSISQVFPAKKKRTRKKKSE